MQIVYITLVCLLPQFSLSIRSEIRLILLWITNKFLHILAVKNSFVFFYWFYAVLFTLKLNFIIWKFALRVWFSVHLLSNCVSVVAKYRISAKVSAYVQVLLFVTLRDRRLFYEMLRYWHRNIRWQQVCQTWLVAQNKRGIAVVVRQLSFVVWNVSARVYTLVGVVLDVIRRINAIAIGVPYLRLQWC